MAPYPDPSTNLMVFSLLALCVVMVVYGLWRLYRVAAGTRHRDVDSTAIQVFLDTMKKPPRPEEQPRTTTLSDEMLRAFYEDVRPRDQRDLH